ncbi:kallikrein-15-like [Tachyglossus aculeatus]|uniref:kallikrein-15-like n=1 Tax=Tachyglossus aculeatus TaxID=9261 RepID=UPI0018F5F759|nr:kallikrein-15-like [Tachyglossus aculeatus]
MQLLTLSLFLVATAAQGGDKVLGGKECVPGSQPWQVALFDFGRFNCGGTLVTPRWVLTAAHCFTRLIRVRLGEHNLKVLEGWEQLRGVSRAIPHPHYRERDHKDDIMLLKLTLPARLTPSVRPLPLPTSCPQSGDRCIVSGWGLVANSKVRLPDSLHCANISIISAAACNVAYPGHVTEAMVCAGVEDGSTDSCEGDSGGPLVCGGQLQGIVSWGDVPCVTTTKPGVYTKVCKYVDWIQDTIRRN